MNQQRPPDPPPPGEENPYLRLRRAKIARNNARLESLGLLRARTSRSAKPATAGASTAPGRTKAQDDDQSSKATHREPLRRSARNAGQNVDYEELPDTDANYRARNVVGRKRGRAVDDTSTGQDIEDTAQTITTAKMTPIISSKPSTRTTDADVGTIVRRWLGTEVGSFGKAAVIEAAVEASSGPLGHISFNKYSGVCEWRNAIFLWVNIGAPGADVVNEFLDGGRKMTWYGGSRMHDETSAIKNLIRIGRKADKADDLPPTDGIVLWCRLYDSSKRALSNYACLGRVAYDSHVPGTRPIEFVLRLLDFDELVSDQARSNGNNSAEPSFFRRIVDFDLQPLQSYSLHLKIKH